MTDDSIARAKRKLAWMDTCAARAAARKRGIYRANSDDTGEWRRNVLIWLAVLEEQGLKYENFKHPDTAEDGSTNYKLSNGEVYIDGEPL